MFLKSKNQTQKIMHKMLIVSDKGQLNQLVEILVKVVKKIQEIIRFS